MAKSISAEKVGTGPPRRRPKKLPECMRLRGAVYYGQVRLQTGKWKHYRLSKDLDVAKQKLRQIQAQADLGQLDAHGRSQDEAVNLLDLIKPYRTSSEGVSEAYLDGVELDATLVFGMLPSPTLPEFTVQNLMTIRGKLAKNKNGRKRSNRTRNRILDGAFRVVRWAVECGKLPNVVLPRLKKLPNRSQDQVRRRHALTLDEARKLVAASKEYDRASAAQPSQRPLFELLLGTGFRFGEAARLQWCDLDSDRESGVSYLRVRQSKNGMPRTNPLTSELAETLAETKREQARILGRLPMAEDFILLAPDSVPWGLKKFREVYSGKLLERVLKLAGLPKVYADGEVIDWHSLRHSFCCLLRDKGIDVGTAAVLMGHKSIVMTQRIYSRYERIEKRGALEALPVFRDVLVSGSCQREA